MISSLSETIRTVHNIEMSLLWRCLYYRAVRKRRFDCCSRHYMDIFGATSFSMEYGIINLKSNLIYVLSRGETVCAKS